MATFVFELDIQTILTTLQRVEGKIDELLGKVNVMSQATDNLAAAVERAAGIDQQILAEINDLIAQNKQLIDQIAALDTSPQVQTLTDRLNQNTDALAAALAAGAPTSADGSAQTIPPTSVA